MTLCGLYSPKNEIIGHDWDGGQSPGYVGVLTQIPTFPHFFPKCGMVVLQSGIAYYIRLNVIQILITTNCLYKYYFICMTYMGFHV